MGAILQINRDFPFQVALSFDEAAMDVLDWLEGQSLDWDMYVDLPADTIRYCFRTMADAMSFKRRFGDAAEERAVVGGAVRGEWLRQVVVTKRFCMQRRERMAAQVVSFGRARPSVMSVSQSLATPSGGVDTGRKADLIGFVASTPNR